MPEYFVSAEGKGAIFACRLHQDIATRYARDFSIVSGLPTSVMRHSHGEMVIVAEFTSTGEPVPLEAA